MTGVPQDLRYALRQLRKNPGFSVMAVLTLAMGIGPTTAIFNLMNAVILRTLPVERPRELVLLGEGRPMGIAVGFPNGNTELFSYRFYRKLQAETEVFSGVAAIQSLPSNVYANVGSGNGDEPVSARLVSGTYFSVLGVNPYLGRLLTDADDQSAGAHPVAVASFSWWAQRFDRDPTIVGKTLTIGSTVFTIVGVTPPEFFGTTVGESPNLWVPLAMQAQIPPGMNGFNDPMFRSLYLIGRLKPGLNPAEASANTNGLFRQSLREYAGSAPNAQRLEDIQHAYVELSSMAAGLSRVRLQVSLPLRILMGVVGLVLLITCANIANLLLARATLRGREIAIRVAVGGSRLRLLRQLLTESVLLCFFAGSLAVAFAWWASQLLVSMVSAGLGALSLDVHLDAPVLTFAAAISLGTALLVGLVPALGSTSVEMIPALRQGKCFPLASARNAIGKVLVVSQVALSVVLLAGAALLLRSLVNLSSVNPGFDASNALLIHLDTSVAGYAPRSTEVNNLYDQLEQRVAAIPGVRAASLAMLTFGEGAWQVPALVPGYLPRSENDNIIHNNVVGTNFFYAMGIRLMAGRSFSTADTKNSARVAIINETMQKRFFGQQSAIGKHFSIGDPGRTRDVEIVGVVSDAKLESLQEPPLPAAYFPYTQYQNYGGGSGYLYDLVVRYYGNSESIAVAVRQAISTVYRNLPISDITTLSEQVNRSVVPQSLISRLSGFLSLFALFLACIGIYGLMSYAVSNQTRDIGIRIALGARYSNVQWMIMSEVLLLVSLGVVIGVPSALATGRLVASMLFRLTPMDPLSMVTAVALMSAVAALAGYLPARRAAKVDPMVALRYE